MKHILFGLNQNSDKKIENQVLDKYKKVTGKDFTFDSEYYLNGIEKALSEKKFDVLILREDLESNKQVPVKFLDNISDKYPQLNVILVVNNEHQADKYIIDIFSLGLYNILYREDLTLGNVVSLIETSRTKLDAKIYLELEDVSEGQEQSTSAEDVMEIPEDELINILNSLRNVKADNISEMFYEINKQYERRQMLFLVSLLPEEIKEIIRASNNEVFLKYEAHWNNKIEKANKEDKINSKRKEQFKENKTKIERIIIEKEKIVEVEKKVVQKVYIEKEKEVKVYERPNDYKKKTGFVGHRGAGTTSLICSIGDFLSQNKIKTAIVDLTKSRDLYDMFPVNQMESIEGDVARDFNEMQALVSLVRGNIKPYKINKSLDLFTACADKDVDITNPFYFIQLLEQEYDVILVDMDYDTPKEVYQILNTVYIIQTLNLPKVKHNTNYQLSLKNMINMKKIKYIINQTIPCALQIKDIASCLKIFTNLETFERTPLTDEDTKYFNVPSSKELMKMSCEMNYNFKKLEKEVLEAIKEIAVDIYPINTKETEGILGKLGRLFKKNKEIVIKEESNNELDTFVKGDKIAHKTIKEPPMTIEEVVITEQPNIVEQVKKEDINSMEVVQVREGVKDTENIVVEKEVLPISDEYTAVEVDRQEKELEVRSDFIDNLFEDEDIQIEEVENMKYTNNSTRYIQEINVEDIDFE